MYRRPSDQIVYCDASTESSYSEAARHAPLKLVILGAAGVGKTTLYLALRRHWRNEDAATLPPLDVDIRPTIGVDYCTVHVPRVHLTLRMWDTAGQERYRALSSVVVRDAAMFIVCFDANRPSTWQDVVEHWAPFISEHQAHEVARGRAAPLVVVVATKLDQYGMPWPAFDRERLTAKAFQARLFARTSALAAPDSVRELARDLETLLLAHRPAVEAAASSRADSRRTVSVRDQSLEVVRHSASLVRLEPRPQVRRKKSSSCAC